MKENDIVFYNTLKGKIEVAITKIFKNNTAKIIWNEPSIDHCGAITGKETIVSLDKLEEIK